MHKKIQEMWDAAHEIPEGAYVPEDTVLVQLDLTDSFSEPELNHYVALVSDYWQGSPKNAPVRSVDPIPDHTDTGPFTALYAGGAIVHIDTDDGRCYDLSKTQARNLARKITEAADGN